MELLFKEESYRIIGACMTVHRIHGSGLKETVYQEAGCIEFDLCEIPFSREEEVLVYYKGNELKSKFVPDFICYNEIIVEFKAVRALTDEHISQVLNYLNAAECTLGLLINFGTPSLTYKRIVL